MSERRDRARRRAARAADRPRRQNVRATKSSRSACLEGHFWEASSITVKIQVEEKARVSFFYFF